MKFGHFWNYKKKRILVKSFFRAIDLFDFTSFFGLDFFKFSGPLFHKNFLKLQPLICVCTIFPFLVHHAYKSILQNQPFGFSKYQGYNRNQQQRIASENNDFTIYFWVPPKKCTKLGQKSRRIWTLLESDINRSHDVCREWWDFHDEKKIHDPPNKGLGFKKVNLYIAAKKVFFKHLYHGI